jgi:hypothetical protein
MKESYRIHVVRAEQKPGEELLCIGHLPRMPFSPDFIAGLIDRACAATERHDALYAGIAGDLYVDAQATPKGLPFNHAASELRRLAIRARDPDSRDGFLLRGKAILVLPVTIEDGGAL